MVRSSSEYFSVSRVRMRTKPRPSISSRSTSLSLAASASSGKCSSPMDADAPIEHRQIVVGIFLGIEGADAHEAATIDQLALDVLELGRERIERKMLQPDVEQVLRMRLGDGERMVELALVLIRQFERPGALVLNVFAMPVDMGF